VKSQKCRLGLRYVLSDCFELFDLGIEGAVTPSIPRSAELCRSTGRPDFVNVKEGA
jgi:hypothetical protein